MTQHVRSAGECLAIQPQGIKIDPRPSFGCPNREPVSRQCTLWKFNIAIAKLLFIARFPLKIIIFHRYIKLLEGKDTPNLIWQVSNYMKLCVSQKEKGVSWNRRLYNTIVDNNLSPIKCHFDPFWFWWPDKPIFAAERIPRGSLSMFSQWRHSLMQDQKENIHLYRLT